MVLMCSRDEQSPDDVTSCPVSTLENSPFILPLFTFYVFVSFWVVSEPVVFFSIVSCLYTI